jgi:hypothetical protein
MRSTIQIDNTTFDTAIERFSFPPCHVITDMAELAKLGRLSRLTSASFSETNLDDRGLVHVASVSSIEHLDLQDTKVSNDGLAHLARLPRLRYLRLKDNRQLTNDCMPHILRMSALVELQIQETSIDQQGVDQLAALTNLEDLCLEVWSNNFTFHGLLELSARMPRCRILAKGRGEFCGGSFGGTWEG